jgi:predicted metalloprotease
MRWEGERESANVDDRRGVGVGGIAAGGGIGTVVLVLIGLFFGVDPSVLLDTIGNGPPAVSGSSRPVDPRDDREKRFVSVVLAETEDTWGELFQRQGRHYEQPRLVLFSGAVQSACGFAQAASGPFYCPADHQAYLDLSFFQELRDRFQAPGDFAAAYVIAHEIGHHVQTLLGISRQVNARRQQAGGAEANRLSVRLELQADCFAGVWAYHTEQRRHILDEGDIDEAIGAASAVGDDRLQKQARGYVVPDAFTHGTSAQRVRWFKHGFAGGDLNQCDTFNAARL